MMQLTRHFTLAEAMASNTARVEGIDNRPPVAIIPRLRFVAETVLERIRAHYAIPIVFDGGLSWYRCPALNRAVGGAADSQHMTGEAVDVEVRGISNVELACFVRDNLDFDQLILEAWDGVTPSSGWVHVSATLTGRHRREVLTYAKGRYTKGLP
ncbi:D-Ala-D-Ala carboxypeptidase family metallohydrolase [Parvibaculum sp.]|uniref:D-Ala-D-Ala carboxypeptidase family metallohydrolase n=1 Tax=Parvibaculum sp. TaxID=2024848 RepID=UPI000C456E76|nr:D-Ala-D-Ala carboxypeptidase family metallohydrolase [Parvibaculum sp.]MAM95664.1 peptidase M15A [Parvibaculum sp.]|tara:strand:- start:13010 stop:13474 length:465 start_codon:yes stop_codon:yes gene_type:complete